MTKIIEWLLNRHLKIAHLTEKSRLKGMTRLNFTQKKSIGSCDLIQGQKPKFKFRGDQTLKFSEEKTKFSNAQLIKKNLLRKIKKYKIYPKLILSNKYKTN